MQVSILPEQWPFDLNAAPTPEEIAEYQARKPNCRDPEAACWVLRGEASRKNNALMSRAERSMHTAAEHAENLAARDAVRLAREEKDRIVRQAWREARDTRRAYARARVRAEQEIRIATELYQRYLDTITERDRIKDLHEKFHGTREFDAIRDYNKALYRAEQAVLISQRTARNRDAKAAVEIAMANDAAREADAAHAYYLRTWGEQYPEHRLRAVLAGRHGRALTPEEIAEIQILESRLTREQIRSIIET
jgi:hypothetical protein